MVFLPVHVPALGWVIAATEGSPSQHSDSAAIAARQLQLAYINFRYSHSTGHHVDNVLLQEK